MNVVDISKLENVRNTNDGCISARCPACALLNEDNQGNNFSLMADKITFNCIKYPDSQHRAQILALVGTEATGEIIQKEVQPKLDVEKSWPIDILKGLLDDTTYWEKRFISRETCKYFQIGRATRGQLGGRSILPIFNNDKSKIIGLIGRTLDDKFPPKYKIMGRKDSFIFGGGDYKNRNIILVESSADILYLFDRNIKNTLCLFGVNISSKLICFLMQLRLQKIIIATNNEPDNHNIGLNAAIKIKERLLQVVDEERVTIGLPPVKDFCDLGADEKNLLDSWRSKYNN